MQQVIPQGCCPRPFCHPYSMIPSLFLPPFSSGHTKFPKFQVLFLPELEALPDRSMVLHLCLPMQRNGRICCGIRGKYGLATAKQCRSNHCQQQLQKGRWSVGDADKENQWQGGRGQANQRGKLARNSWAEQHPIGTSWKNALQGNKPHLSWVPASQKNNKEDDSSQKEVVINLFTGNVTEEGKGRAAPSQRAAALFWQCTSSFWAHPPFSFPNESWQMPIVQEASERRGCSAGSWQVCQDGDSLLFFLRVNTHVQPWRPMAKFFAGWWGGKRENASLLQGDLKPKLLYSVPPLSRYHCLRRRQGQWRLEDVSCKTQGKSNIKPKSSSIYLIVLKIFFPLRDLALFTSKPGEETQNQHHAPSTTNIMIPSSCHAGFSTYICFASFVTFD